MAQNTGIPHFIKFAPQKVQTNELIGETTYDTFGPRLASKYFWTKGHGSSGAGTSSLPYETGSYDAALCACGIGNANITSYSSVFPTNAVAYDKSEYANVWGEVLEVILATTNDSVAVGQSNLKLGAGLLQSKVWQYNTYLGSFACEYSSSSLKGGTPSESDFYQVTFQDIYEMIERRYGSITEPESTMALGKMMYTVNGGYRFEAYTGIYDEVVVDAPSDGVNHGTVLAGVVFTEWKYPKASQ